MPGNDTLELTEAFLDSLPKADASSRIASNALRNASIAEAALDRDIAMDIRHEHQYDLVSYDVVRLYIRFFNQFIIMTLLLLLLLLFFFFWSHFCCILIFTLILLFSYHFFFPFWIVA